MDVLIRLEAESDWREVESLTREAFWNLFKPGCDEHYLVHKLRQVPAFVRELTFVACCDGRIIGNIMYSRARVVNEAGGSQEVLCMGPLAVLPEYQKHGVGAQLMRHSIERARELGYKGVVIYGHPAYYPRFGYRDAGDYGIHMPDGGNMDAFMALELYTGALNGINGRFFEDDVFHHLDSEEVERFDAGFPYREKLVTDTQFGQ